MLIVGDIGGTNARFGCVDRAGLVCDVMSLPVAAHGTFEAALRQYCAQVGRPAVIEAAALAIAAPVIDGVARLTNSGWVVSAAAVQAACGAQRVALLNDFEALALALPLLTQADVVSLGGGAIDRRLPMAVIGPGTGLGVAACVPDGAGDYLALASEGGHVTLAPGDDFEAEVLGVVRRQFGHVSAERLLSGIGLPVLHSAIATACGEVAAQLSPEEITQRAQHGDGAATRTLELFCAMLGGFAGNVVLTLGARGGLFVAGGIGQRLAGYLPGSAFRRRFEAKGRFADYLAPLATVLVSAPNAALLGCAARVARPARVPGNATRT